MKSQSISQVKRQLKHTRTIQVQAYERDDGLWDLDANISDVKTRSLQLASGLRPAGHAIHDMSLRLTIDVAMNVVAVQAISSQVPYPGFCETITPAYQKLVGLNLFRQFRQQVRVLYSGVDGCTHITELAQILPTAALQAFAGEVYATGDVSGDASAEQPFQLDRCHALRLDGPAVLRYYPRWAGSGTGK